jgi:ClpP class serine protease
MVVDSPGGVVSGLNECVAELRRMRAEHPEIKVSCYVNEMATSAAYALACSCDEIVCPPSAILGSVGVISTMISAAAHDKKEGFDVRLLTSGARKADGHLHAPISDAAITVEQARVEKLANAFFRLVSKARPISVDKLRNLQAGIYLGKDAIRVKLADRLMAYADLLAGAQGDSPLAAQGGNQTDRRLSKGKRMNLDALIKKTKAALAATDDPTEIRELSTALGTYSAALEAYKKTEKHVEHVKTEESADEDEEPEEKSTEEEKKAKGAEEEKAASSAKSEDDEDDEDDADDAKSAKKALALVQQVTGMTGKKALGALQAIAMTAEQAAKDVAALKREGLARDKAALIASAKGKYLTAKEATWLGTQKMSVVQGFVEMRRKSGVIVHTDETTIVKPKDAVPGTEESLPQFTRDMIDAAVAAMPMAKREKGRAELVAAHLKSHNEQLETALNGAGRY